MKRVIGNAESEGILSMSSWGAITAEEAAARLQVDINSGLTWEEAKARLVKHGPNRLIEDPPGVFFPCYLRNSRISWS